MLFVGSFAACHRISENRGFAIATVRVHLVMLLDLNQCKLRDLIISIYTSF